MKNNNYLDAIEAKDTLKCYLQEMMDTGYSHSWTESAMQHLEDTFKTIQNHWNNSRGLEELLKLMKENKSLEVNEDEYTTLKEFYEMHDIGFALEEAYYDNKYFKIARLESERRI